MSPRAFLEKYLITAPVLQVKYLDQLLSAVLDFHSGVLIAIDSAKQIGISTNLRVYDTQKRNSDRIKSILIDENFSNADAVIGPVTQGNFDLVSDGPKPPQFLAGLQPKLSTLELFFEALVRRR